MSLLAPFVETRRANLRTSVNPTALARGLLADVRRTTLSASGGAARGPGLRPTTFRSSPTVESRASYGEPLGRSPRPVIGDRRTFNFGYTSVARGAVGQPSNRASMHIDYILRDSAIAIERAEELLGPEALVELAALDAASVWRMDADAIGLDHLEAVTGEVSARFAADLSGDEEARRDPPPQSEQVTRSEEFLTPAFADQRMAWTNVGSGRADALRLWRGIEADEQAPSADTLHLAPSFAPFWGHVSRRKDMPAELRRAVAPALDEDGELTRAVRVRSFDGRRLLGWLLDATPRTVREALPGRRLPVRAVYGRGGTVQNRIIAEVPWALADARRPDAIRLVVTRFAERLRENAGGAELPWVAAIHKPYGHNDPRNWHCHFVFHMRPFTLDGTRPAKVRLDRRPEWIPNLRAAWADACNEQLRFSSAAVMLDPRRTALIAEEAGIDPMWLPPPQAKLPPAAAAIDRRGVATLPGMRAGLTALEALHLRADRQAAAAAAGADGVLDALRPFLSDLRAGELHASWQSAHANYVEARRAATMLRAHAEAAARPSVDAARFWDLAAIADREGPGHGPLYADRRPTLRNPATMALPPALRRPDVTRRNILNIAAALPRALTSRQLLAADAAVADRQSAASAIQARAAWDQLRQVIPRAALANAANAYRTHALDEREIAHSGRMIRELDRLLDRGIMPAEAEINRIGLSAVPHAQVRLAAQARRQQRIEAVLAGRAIADPRCEAALAVAAARGRGLAGVAAPRGLSRVTRNAWRRLSETPAMLSVAQSALDRRVSDMNGLPARQRRPLVAYAVMRSRAERGAAFQRRAQQISLLPAGGTDVVTVREAAAAMIIRNARVGKTLAGPRLEPLGIDARLRAAFAEMRLRGAEERRKREAREREAARRRQHDQSRGLAQRIQRRAEWLAVTSPQLWGESVTLREQQVANVLAAQHEQQGPALTLAPRRLPQLEAQLAAHIDRQRGPRAETLIAAAPARMPAAAPQAKSAPETHGALPTSGRVAASDSFADRRSRELVRIQPVAPQGEFAWPEAGRVGRALCRLHRRAQRLDGLSRRLARDPARIDLATEVSVRSAAAKAAGGRLAAEIARWTAGVAELQDWRSDGASPAYDAYRLASAAGAPDGERKLLAFAWALRLEESPSPARVPAYRRDEVVEAILAADPRNRDLVRPRRQMILEMQRGLGPTA